MDPCNEREVSEFLQEPHADAPGIVSSYSFLTLFIALTQEWGYTIMFSMGRLRLKWHYDENCFFPIKAILENKQVACMRRKMLFTIFNYLFSFQRYSSF